MTRVPGSGLCCLCARVRCVWWCFGNWVSSAVVGRASVVCRRVPLSTGFRLLARLRICCAGFGYLVVRAFVVWASVVWLPEYLM